MDQLFPSSTEGFAWLSFRAISQEAPVGVHREPRDPGQVVLNGQGGKVWIQLPAGGAHRHAVLPGSLQHLGRGEGLGPGDGHPPVKATQKPVDRRPAKGPCHQALTLFQPGCVKGEPAPPPAAAAAPPTAGPGGAAACRTGPGSRPGRPPPAAGNPKIPSRTGPPR